MSRATPAARTEALLGLEQELGRLVRELRPLLWSRARDVHPDLQVSSYFLLGYLVEHGPVRAATISEALGIDKGAISRQLGHLGDLGLVLREPDRQDRRATLVSATPDAVRRMAQVAEQRRRRAGERLADWSDEELRDFAGMLARYREAIR